MGTEAVLYFKFCPNQKTPFDKTRPADWTPSEDAVASQGGSVVWMAGPERLTKEDWDRALNAYREWSDSKHDISRCRSLITVSFTKFYTVAQPLLLFLSSCLITPGLVNFLPPTLSQESDQHEEPEQDKKEKERSKGKLGG